VATEVFLDEKIKLQVDRCYDCGRFWALEVTVTGTCPRCAQQKVERAWDETKTAQRSASALRAALARDKALVERARSILRQERKRGG
jgi:hypothetical protein